MGDMRIFGYIVPSVLRIFMGKGPWRSYDG